jgi:serine phosphatase RsbU (regulator of sigma subunit)
MSLVEDGAASTDAVSSTDAVPGFEWGVAAHAFFGQTESGDQYVVEPVSNGLLVAVVDGLGHGPKAAKVAKKTVDILQTHIAPFTNGVASVARTVSVATLLKHCHEGLRGTRGVVMSLAYIDVRHNTMTWLGIGNVNALLLTPKGGKNPAREWLLVRGGVVGYHIPTLRPDTLPISPGDVLVFATDGLRSNFTEALFLDGSPQEIADHVMARHRRGSDDALVLVVRYDGHTERSVNSGVP